MNGTQQLPQGDLGGMQQGGFPRGGPPGGLGGPRGMMGLLPGGPVTYIVIAVIFVITVVALAIAFYKLYQKAGLNGAVGLLMLIPVVNIGVAFYLAFADWPVLKELERLRLLVASATPLSSPEAPVMAPAETTPREAAVPLATQ
jgi:hypothetical protein